MRALFASAADLGGVSPEWARRAEGVPGLLHELKLELAPGLEPALQTLRDVGHRLWIITKGDVLRQAMKLAAFPLDAAFDHIEIVQRKNVATYSRVLAARSSVPGALTMVGDSFFEDVVPPLWLGRAPFICRVDVRSWHGRLSGCCRRGVSRGAARSPMCQAGSSLLTRSRLLSMACG